MPHWVLWLFLGINLSRNYVFLNHLRTKIRDSNVLFVSTLWVTSVAGRWSPVVPFARAVTGPADLRAHCHGHARPRHVAYGRMLMTSQTLYDFSYSSILLLYFRKYDVSEISCLDLSDMKCLRMYCKGIRLIVNFSLHKVIYCEPLLFLSCLLIITSLSKISLCPRFLKHSLKIEARGSSIRRLVVGDARTNWLSSLVLGKWVSHNRKSATITNAIVTPVTHHGASRPFLKIKAVFFFLILR